MMGFLIRVIRVYLWLDFSYGLNVKAEARPGEEVSAAGHECLRG